MPSGKTSSSTTAPQWHDARWMGLISVGPTDLITGFPPCCLSRLTRKEALGCAGGRVVPEVGELPERWRTFAGATSVIDVIRL